MTEIEKYKLIYSGDEYGNYGHWNHGQHSYDLMVCLCPSSIVDIGCGYNEYCNFFKQMGVPAVGVDFACPAADVRAAATSLPFENKSFDVLTSFDVLEHLLPEEIDLAFSEFSRISRRFLFSICYRPSVIMINGENLHPSVFPETWWIEKLQKMAVVIQYRDYLLGKWK